MYHTTGYSRAEIQELCEMIKARFGWTVCSTGRKRSLGLFKCVTVTLAYLRRNRVQAELAEYFETSQPTISRVIAATMPLLEAVLRDWVPTADDLNPTSQLIIDGTLLPCWSWQAEEGLWSGKHHTTGVNVQVACTLSGRLAWVSDPMRGSTHDAKAIRESGLLDPAPGEEAIPLHLGDKGYIGLGMLTPYRKPPGGELKPWQKEFNKTVNSVRASIERVIANLKTWRIFHTDYRRPFKTFEATISTVIALEFFRTRFEFLQDPF